ncbi:MAG: DUF5723 family protein [Prevotellaceae bacterium]|jgi:hypothetical protein|nr:DUF5723 family protein [Prevotellaceae bacterium]
MKYFIPFVMLLLTTVKVHAQLNPTLYHMKDLPLNSQLNPAFQPRNGSLYIGFPGLTSLAPNLMLSGKGLTPDNVYFSPNYGAIVESKDKQHAGIVDYEHNLINFGFMLKNMYFTFDSKVKLNVEGSIPKDLERLIWYGNGDSETIGEKLSLNGLGASALGYGEISLGVSVEVIPSLFVGAKAKYLQGIGYMRAKLGEDSYIKTDENSYHITVGFNPDIYLAGIPIKVPEDNFSINELTDAKLSSYKFDAGNAGVAFDLGGSWDLPSVKGLNVSASALDLGFINFKGDKIENSSGSSSELTFDGVSISGGDFATSLLDSVEQKAIVKSSKGSSERKWLSPTVYAGVSYEVWKYLNVGALLGYRFSQQDKLPLAAVSVNTQGLPVNLSASYSYYNRLNNVGVGVLFGHKIVQLHVIADNLLAINYKKAQNVNLRVGVNFLFGKDRSKRRPPAAAEGDILAPESGDEFADTAALPEAEAEVIDTTIIDTTTTVTPKISREMLLKRAITEEERDGDTPSIKRLKKAKPKSRATVQKKTSKENLIERAIREEAEDSRREKSKGKK